MKEEKEELYEIEEKTESSRKFEKNFENTTKIVTLIAAVILIFFAVSIIISNNEIIIKFFGIAMVIAALTGVAKAFGSDRIQNILVKLYGVIFLMIWYGIVGFATYSMLKGDGDKSGALILIPFWIAGFFATYSILIKKNE